MDLGAAKTRRSPSLNRSIVPTGLSAGTSTTSLLRVAFFMVIIRLATHTISRASGLRRGLDSSDNGKGAKSSTPDDRIAKRGDLICTFHQRIDNGQTKRHCLAGTGLRRNKKIAA